MEFETVIGLEVHAQLLTTTKIFCGCTTRFGAGPNTQGCPVCLGLPGALPVLNRSAVDMAIACGLALGCSIAPTSVFARKNYFYPDLPKGYQISQYDLPVCSNGLLTVTADGSDTTVRIRRIHLEEDAGKLIHDQDSDSLFDVNRCGTPLIEIVTEPDLRTSAQAYAYLSELKLILECLNICDCNMEEGSLRCDANVSIRRIGQTTLGTKAELKNMNSWHGVEKAIDYEVKRQIQIVQSGGAVLQQTFLWDPDKNRTIAMRSKESENDYRYFPDPDLTPLIIEQDRIDMVAAKLPELPAEKRSRFISDYKLTPYMAEVLTGETALAAYFEEVVSHCSDTKLAANWVMGEVLRIHKEEKKAIVDLPITPGRLGTLLGMVSGNAISANAAKKVFDAMLNDQREPGQIVAALGLSQISDASALEELMKKIIEAHPVEVDRFKAGDQKLSGFFIGKAMKETRGKGNPQELNRIFLKLTGTSG